MKKIFYFNLLFGLFSLLTITSTKTDQDFFSPELNQQEIELLEKNPETIFVYLSEEVCNCISAIHQITNKKNSILTSIDTLITNNIHILEFDSARACIDCSLTYLQQNKDQLDQETCTNIITILEHYKQDLDSDTVQEESTIKRGPKLAFNLRVIKNLQTNRLKVCDTACIIGLLTTGNVHIRGNLIVDGFINGIPASTAITSDPNDINQGGNSYGATIVIGSLDNNSMNFITNSTTQATILTNGNVGIGTTTPVQQLQITENFRLPITNAAGTAGVVFADGNTLIHEFDGAGGGANFFAGVNAGNLGTTSSNNTGIGNAALQGLGAGLQNSAVGSGALQVNSSGSDNSALGFNALNSNIGGIQNTAVGSEALLSNVSGTSNTAIGRRALLSNDASNNTAVGEAALQSNDTGVQNVAIGVNALQGGNGGNLNDNVAIGVSALQLVLGASNIALGTSAGVNYDNLESSNIVINNNGTNGESNTLRIGAGTGAGTQQLNQAFISGIQGVVVTGVNVLVSAADQLGVAASSRQFKSNIQDMAESSDVIMKLRPVTFTWNKQSAPGLHDAPTTTQFGLIAEEVAEVFPELVVYDEKAQPVSVRYQDLPPLLLNEMQKLQQIIKKLSKKIEILENKFADN